MLESIKQDIISANNFEMGFLLVILAVICALSLYGIFRYFHRSRIIDDTPTSKIRSAHQGFVELEGHGRLMQGTPIISPLSKKKCLWYDYKIEHIASQNHIAFSRSDSRVGSVHWEIVDSGVSDNLFLLNDGTGICVIDPEGAVITPSFAKSWYGDKQYPVSDVNSATGVLNLVSANLMHNKSYRYSEKRIDIGDALYVLGGFKTVGGRRENLDTAAETRDLLATWKTKPEFLVTQFDENGDGEIDMKEWQGVMDAARKEVKASYSERLVQPEIHVLSKPVDKDRPFIISVERQQNIASKYRWYSSGSIAGFFISGISLLWIIGVRLAN